MTNSFLVKGGTWGPLPDLCAWIFARLHLTQGLGMLSTVSVSSYAQQYVVPGKHSPSGSPAWIPHRLAFEIPGPQLVAQFWRLWNLNCMESGWRKKAAEERSLSVMFTLAPGLLSLRAGWLPVSSCVHRQNKQLLSSCSFHCDGLRPRKPCDKITGFYVIDFSHVFCNIGQKNN